MNHVRCVVGIVVVLLMLVPCLAAGHQESIPGLSVWVVNASPGDTDTGLAVQTLRHETTQAGLGISETSLSRLASVPLNVGVLILIGHGQPDGLVCSGGVVVWSELYETIAERQPQRTIVLACYSPSDVSSGVFGFHDRVDAEAGAMVVSWFLRQLTNPDTQVVFPLDRVASAQVDMLHPLGRYLYFIHGYWGLTQISH